MIKNKSKIYALFAVGSLFILTNLLFINMTTASKENAPNLLQRPDLQGSSMKVSLPSKIRNGRARHVQINSAALDSESLTLNLFDDTQFIAIRDRLTKDLKGRTVWIGKLKNIPSSEVVLTSVGNVMMGTVSMNDRFFEIVYVNGNTHAVREIDPDHLPKDFEPSSNSNSDTTSSTTSSTSTTSGATISSTGSIQQIDLMVVYTTQARVNAGGDSGIQTKILNAVARANQAYLNSQINISLNLVYMGETAYADSGDMTIDLARLQNPSDGYMDEVHSLRDLYSADLVSLISTDSNYCGYANIMTSVSTGFASSAFSVLHDDSVYSCLGANNSFPHELGHNMGNVHNPENTSIGGAYAESYGYRICGNFRDIMSYSCSGETRIPYFSNPNIYYNGLPIGIVGTNDTSNSMNKTASTVANFRNSPTSLPPNPSNLQLSSSAGSIQLNWTDNSSNESGFKIQRSLDGINWISLATVSSNVTTYKDSGLTSGQIYYYSVVAFNGIGDSGSTNIASLVAPYPDTTLPVVNISNPIQGTTITGTVSVSVSATDNVKVSSVKLYIDNKLVSSSSTSGTFTYNWNTKKATRGIHTISAQAVDSSGNTSSISITVSK